MQVPASGTFEPAAPALSIHVVRGTGKSTQGRKIFRVAAIAVHGASPVPIGAGRSRGISLKRLRGAWRWKGNRWRARRPGCRQCRDRNGTFPTPALAAKILFAMKPEQWCRHMICHDHGAATAGAGVRMRARRNACSHAPMFSLLRSRTVSEKKKRPPDRPGTLHRSIFGATFFSTRMFRSNMRNRDGLRPAHHRRTYFPVEYS